MKFIKFVFICFLFYGCASNYTYKNRAYKKVDLTNRTVMFLPPVIDSISIERPGNIISEFSDGSIDDFNIVRSHLTERIISNMRSEIINIEIAQPLLDISLIDKTHIKENYDEIPLYLYDKFTSINVPKKEYLESLGYSPDFVCILDHIEFIWTEAQSATMIGTQNFGGGHLPGVTARFRYIVWDYKNYNYVSYGSSFVHSTYMRTTNREFYIKIFDDISRVLFKKTPFPFYVEPEPFNNDQPRDFEERP